MHVALNPYIVELIRSPRLITPCKDLSMESVTFNSLLALNTYISALTHATLRMTPVLCSPRSNLSKVELQRQLQTIIDTMSSCPVSADLGALSDALYKFEHFDGEFYV